MVAVNELSNFLVADDVAKYDWLKSHAYFG